MVALIRITTLILITLLVSLCLSKGLGYVSSPMSQNYREVTEHLHYNGKVVCWNGICPGQTTFGEAKKLSAKYPVLSSISYGFDIQYSKQIIVQVSNHIGTDSAPVDIISLEFASNYLTLADLVLLIGDPYSVNGRTRVQLPWQKGICFSRGLSAFFQGTIHRIQSNLSVVSLVIMDSTRDSYCSSTEYVPWQGFAHRPFYD